MGEVLKQLGQSAPAAATATTLYTVPASTSTVVSTLTVCNQNSTSKVKVRVWTPINGAADAAQQYILYDYLVLPNDFLALTLGTSLAAGDTIRVQSDTANVSFIACGCEVS